VSGGALLDVRDVRVSFDGIRVLDNLSLSLQPGELRFLIGPNGAGKTTLMDVVTGKTRPHSGHVSFDGHDALRLQPHQLARLGMGRKFQTPSIFNSLTVRENLEIAGGFAQSGWRLLRPLEASTQRQIADVLEVTQLGAELATRAGVL